MSNNPLFDLADDCQKAADEIDARLLDFAHPLNTALRNELNDQSAKLSIAASAGTSCGCSAAGATGCTLSQATRGWMTR